ncbi:MAG: hypothetical protein IJX43_01695 [Alphaproteobacteria bacterium]|nr:hypothetical protein [Alphaproteobacteria bacterium]
MKKIILLYNIPTTQQHFTTSAYKCADEDDTPIGTVEPCAGTDTEEPSCGIAILDTDGEWIEMKNNSSHIPAKHLYTTNKQRLRAHQYNNKFSRLH